MDIEKIRCQQLLLSLGKVAPLKGCLSVEEVKKSIEGHGDYFRYYNPAKKGYNRYGLSITSLDGGMSGRPDLDSLVSYNLEHGTSYDEGDFRTQTPFYRNCHELKRVFGPFENYMGRSHILRLDRGGMFPPHRDSIHWEPTCFRIFVSLEEDGEGFVFLLDNQRIFFQPGRPYFINTALGHSLFSFKDSSFFTVFNIDFCREAIGLLAKNLYSR